MNEFYEAVSNLFEELRCDSGEREYTVQPEESKMVISAFAESIA